MAKPTRQEIDRIIVGNQIQIMEALSTMSKSLVGDIELSRKLDGRSKATKEWWENGFGEDAGYFVFSFLDKK